MRKNLFTVIANVLLISITVAVIGCGCSGTDSAAIGSGGTGILDSSYNPLNPEEPLITIRAITGRADVAITGYGMDVYGTDPDGTPYNYKDFIIKGAGLQGINQSPNGLEQFNYPYMYVLANNSGANCVRLYGAAFTEAPSYSGETPAQQAQDVDAAFAWARNATAKGSPMFVAPGITMADSTAIDYTNTAAGSPLLVQRALIESFVDNVIALQNDRQLMWIIGNELVKSTNPTVKAAVYGEINVIAQYIEKAGSNLPCMTAVPTVTTDELVIIAKNCPNLDILGINDYYGTFGATQGGGYLNTLNAAMTASRLDKNGWQKPYIVSEFGSYDLGGLNMPTITLPPPPQYVPQGVYALEANSTNVAQDYSDNYRNYIAPYLTTGCLGSFCYIWQNPVFSNHYAYFFEMIISGPLETPSYNPLGRYRLQAADNMIGAWGGTSPGLPYPEIAVTDGDPQGIVCTFKATQQNLAPDPVTGGQSLTASVTVNFTGTLQYNWYIVDDNANNHYNPQNYEGPVSSPPNGVSQTTAVSGNSQTNTVTFTAPQNTGQYQLRVTITSGSDPGPSGDPTVEGTAATAAVFFTVK